MSDTGKFSNELIQKIKSMGVLEYAKQYTELTKIGNIHQGKCPHPDHEDITPSFTIFEDGSWVCFGCHCGPKDNVTNFGNDNIAFVMWMSNHKKSSKRLSFVEAVIELAKFYNIPIEYDKYFIIYDSNKKQAVDYYYRGLKDQAVFSYLTKERGLDETDIAKWCIGYNGSRITFPIVNRQRDVVGFSNRAFSEASIESGCKYKNSPNSEVFNKKKILYGINYYNDASDKILLTEGQFDVILAHKYGIDYAVAPMCCHLSEYHIAYIKKSGKIPVLCFDDDKAGQDGIVNAINELRKADINNIMVLRLPKGKDLADTALMYKDSLKDYIEENTRTYGHALVEKIADEIDSHLLSFTKNAMDRVQSIISTIPDNNERNLIEKFFKKRLHVWL